MIELNLLRALLKVCREEGVQQFSCPEAAFVLGPRPPVLPSEAEPPAEKSADDKLDEELFNQG